jgi:hypothetical protein
MNKVARLSVYLILLYTCVEGLVINILYPSKIPYVAKDFVILVLYLLLLLVHKNRFLLPSSTMHPLFAPFLTFSILMLIYLALPGVEFFGKLVAIKQRLFYIPLIGLAYFWIRSMNDVKRLFWIFTASAVIVSLYGIYQHFVGPEALREIGANYSAELYTPSTGSGNQVYWRVPGTFTSPGQYGAYLQFSGLMITAFIISGIVKGKYKILSIVSLAAVFCALLLSGSRAALVLLIASLAILFLVTRKVGRLATAAFVGYALLAYGYSFLGEGVKDRFASIASFEHIERFQSTYFGQLFLPKLMEKPMGSGLGTATIGTRHFSEFHEIELVESYFGIIAFETGVLGLCAILWLSFAILRFLFRSKRFFDRSPSSMPAYGFAVYVLFTILILPVSTCIDSAPSNLYFWFSVGSVMKLVDLERKKMKITQALVIVPKNPITLEEQREVV